MDSPFLGIDHLGIAVSDLEAAVATYGDVLGFPITGREELPERGLAVSFVDTGNSHLELIAPTRADSEVARFLARHGEGLHHVCVRVRELDSVLADLRRRGARLIDETPRRGAGGSRVAFVHPKSTHGVLLELVELTE